MPPSTMFVRPAPGLTIFDPDSGQYLPEAGQIVPRSGFWLRRLADGDVLEAAAAPTPKPAKGGKE